MITCYIISIHLEKVIFSNVCQKLLTPTTALILACVCLARTLTLKSSAVCHLCAHYLSAAADSSLFVCFMHSSFRSLSEGGVSRVSGAMIKVSLLYSGERQCAYKVNRDDWSFFAVIYLPDLSFSITLSFHDH